MLLEPERNSLLQQISNGFFDADEHQIDFRKHLLSVFAKPVQSQTPVSNQALENSSQTNAETSQGSKIHYCLIHLEKATTENTTPQPGICIVFVIVSESPSIISDKEPIQSNEKSNTSDSDSSSGNLLNLFNVQKKSFILIRENVQQERNLHKMINQVLPR